MLYQFTVRFIFCLGIFQCVSKFMRRASPFGFRIWLGWDMSKSMPFEFDFWINLDDLVINEFVYEAKCIFCLLFWRNVTGTCVFNNFNVNAMNNRTIDLLFLNKFKVAQVVNESKKRWTSFNDPHKTWSLYHVTLMLY